MKRRFNSRLIHMDLHVTDYLMADAPLGFVIGENFVITNGAFPDELAVWEITSSADSVSIFKSQQNSPRLNEISLQTGLSLDKVGSWDEIYNELEIINAVSSNATEIKRSDSTVVTANYSLSESKALKCHGLDIPPFRDIKSVFTDSDATCVLACSSQPHDGIFLQEINFQISTNAYVFGISELIGREIVFMKDFLLVA